MVSKATGIVVVITDKVFKSFWFSSDVAFFPTANVLTNKTVETTFVYLCICVGDQTKRVNKLAWYDLKTQIINVK